MIRRLRSLAEALEYYLRTNGEAAVAITNRSRVDELRQRQSMRFDVETHEQNKVGMALNARATAASEATAEATVYLYRVMGETTQRLARIEAKLGILGEPSGGQP